MIGRSPLCPPVTGRVRLGAGRRPRRRGWPVDGQWGGGEDRPYVAPVMPHPTAPHFVGRYAEADMETGEVAPIVEDDDGA